MNFCQKFLANYNAELKSPVPNKLNNEFIPSDPSFLQFRSLVYNIWAHWAIQQRTVVDSTHHSDGANIALLALALLVQADGSKAMWALIIATPDPSVYALGVEKVLLVTSQNSHPVLASKWAQAQFALSVLEEHLWVESRAAQGPCDEGVTLWSKKSIATVSVLLIEFLHVEV